MALYVFRHCQTDWNREKRLQGRMETELNETGIAQAKRMAEILAEKQLTFDRIYTSPLERAVRSCELVTRRSREEFVRDTRITEIDFGAMEGAGYDSLRGSARFFFTEPERYTPPENGEPLSALMRRTTSFLESIKEEAERSNVFLASHGTAIHTMILFFRKQSLRFLWEERVGNGDVFVADVVQGRYVLRPGKFSLTEEGRGGCA